MMLKDYIRKNKRIITGIFLILFWLLFACLFLLSIAKPLYQDEGVFLAIGKGLATGKIPYLDFWDHKTPGIYYMWGLLYPIFGTKIILYKFFIWFINFVTAFFVYKISEKLLKGSGKFGVIIFLCSLTFFEGNYLIAEPFVTLLTAISLWLVLSSQKYLSYFMCGFFLSVAILFKQTALFSLPAMLIYILFQKDFKIILSFIVGILLPIFLLIIHLFSQGSISAFWNQAIIVNLSQYPREPISKVLASWAETFMRVWWLLAGIIVSVFNQGKVTQKSFLMFMTAFFPIIAFFVRPYPHYWIQVLPFLSILAGSGFMSLFEWLYSHKYNAVIIPLFLIILFSIWQNILWYRWVTNSINKPKETEQSRVIELLDNLPQASLVTENRFIGFYYLSSREPLTKYLYLTEVNEKESARVKTLDALKKSRGTIILWPTDQKYVYAREIGDWAVQNTRKIAEFTELEMSVYMVD